MDGNSIKLRRRERRERKRFLNNGGNYYGKNHRSTYGGNNGGGNEEFPKFRDKQQQQIQNQRGRRQATYSANWSRWNNDGVVGRGGGNNWNQNHGNKMEEQISTTMTGENNSRHDGDRAKPWNRDISNNEETIVNSTTTTREHEARHEGGSATKDWNHSRINENEIANFPTLAREDIVGIENISAATAAIAQVSTSIAVPNQSSLLEDKKPLLSKIKIEKSEVKVKPTAPPPSKTKPSSSSSDNSSSDDDDDDDDDKNNDDAAETRNPKQTTLPAITNKQKTTVKETTKNKNDKHKKAVIEPTPSSSSSSEDSSSESDEESSSRNKKTIREPIKPVTVITEKKTKNEKKKSKSKTPVDEDLICLGKLEHKYVIKDDDVDVMDEEQQEPTSLKKEQCMLCDRKGHTAFQCQMICKNCSAPYHNHKSCPKPANLTIMLQYFMEFCMQQLQHFNPEQKFLCPPNVNSQATGASISTKASTPSKQKRIHNKSKQKVKASAKRRRNKVSDSDEDENDDDEVADSTANTTEDSSAASSSESEYSVATSSSAKHKSKRAKTSTHSNDAAAFNNIYGSPAAGITPFSALPAAALAAYNPMLFNQMLQSGFPGALNFKK